MSRVWKRMLVIVTILFFVFIIGSANVYADDGDVTLSVSPMKESVILNPGDVYKSSFNITNISNDDVERSFHVEVRPFYVDENYDTVFINESDRGRIAEWIKISTPVDDVIKAGETKSVEFVINVPKDAAAGGQYAGLTVSMELTRAGEGVGIGETLSISHVVFAEITGDSIYGGEILDANVDSFILGGNIRASSSVKNTGNVHATATYTMKIYPLFSDTPIYDMSEEPEKHIVLPDRTFYNENYWFQTPMTGIFNVLYTVEFQGLTTEVTRMVIVCPWWLLFIIMFILIIMVIRIITLVKLRKVNRTVF